MSVHLRPNETLNGCACFPEVAEPGATPTVTRCACAGMEAVVERERRLSTWMIVLGLAILALLPIMALGVWR